MHIFFYRELICTLTFPAHKTYAIVLNKAPKILYKTRRNICQKGQVNESCKNGHMLMLVWNHRYSSDSACQFSSFENGLLWKQSHSAAQEKHYFLLLALAVNFAAFLFCPIRNSSNCWLDLLFSTHISEGFLDTKVGPSFALLPFPWSDLIGKDWPHKFGF